MSAAPSKFFSAHDRDESDWVLTGFGAMSDAGAETIRSWLVQRNNTIITVVFVIIGAVLVGDGIGQL